MPTATARQDSNRPSGRRLPRLVRVALRWTERGLAIFGGLVVLSWLTIDTSVIISQSMSPTLQGTNVDTGDRVLTEKVSFRFRKPRRWEVITFVDKSGQKVMKRVVGLPGESVQMREPRVLLIDGQPIDCPPTFERRYLQFGNLADGKPVPCGTGYYVLGDYLQDSEDSRFEGPVPPGRIIGRAWLIYRPWPRFGWVR
jgi:signal peptidase I